MSKTYSKKKDGNVKLSKNFTVKEFACKDGSDTIVIDMNLVKTLQAIRDDLGIPLTINSGYRTVTYNKRIGGSSNSKHLSGMAADISAKGIHPIVLSYYANKHLNGTGGVELADYTVYGSGYTHIDVRNGYWRSVKPSSTRSYVTVPELFPVIKFGVNSGVVQILTRKFIYLNLISKASSICNSDVVKAIKTFQNKYGLTVDGYFGKKSWSKLIEVLKG